MNSTAARLVVVPRKSVVSSLARSGASRYAAASRTSLRQHVVSRQSRRGYADSATVATESAKSHSPAIIGGIVGGGAVLALGYGWYHFSGAKTLVNSLHSVKAQFDSATKSVRNSAPEPNEALKWLRSTSLAYAGFIPGAKYYVGKAFDDLDAVHEKHAGEVDQIVQDTYSDLKSLTTKKGLSLDTASEAMSILTDAMNKIGELAVDAGEELLKNHPELKSQLGNSISQLKSAGDSFGPEAKKKVDETWEQIRGIAAKGLSISTIPEIKKLVEDKIQQVRKLGDEAWDKGLEQAKPYLDKFPQAKELIEKNKDILKQGDLKTLIEKVKQAADSGSVDDLSKYVESAKDKAKQAGKSMSGGGGLEKYLSLIPNGGEITDKLHKLAEIGQQHGKEAEKLMNDAVNEISNVLQQKTQEAEKLAEKASRDASSK